MTPDDFRRIALGFEGVEEGAHMGAADFRVGGRIFATLAHVDQGFGNLMLTPEVQADFVADAPDYFQPVSGGGDAWAPPTCAWPRYRRTSCTALFTLPGRCGSSATAPAGLDAPREAARSRGARLRGERTAAPILAACRPWPTPSVSTRTRPSCA